MEQESARIPLPQRVETLVKTDVIKNLQSRPKKKKKNLQELPKLIHLKPNITVENSVKGSSKLAHGENASNRGLSILSLLRKHYCLTLLDISYNICIGLFPATSEYHDFHASM